MALDQSHKDAMEELDSAFRGEQSSPFAQAAVTEDWDDYAPWYARLLSSLVLLTAGERVVFAQGTKTYDAHQARALVFTDTLMVLADIGDVNADQVPHPIARSRQSIRSLQVATKTRIDIQGSSALGWPGTIRLSVSYAGMDGPIEFDTLGTDRSGQPGPGLQLLAGLKDDLRAATTQHA